MRTSNVCYHMHCCRYSTALQTQVSSIYQLLVSDSSFTWVIPTLTNLQLIWLVVPSRSGRSDVSQSLTTYANSLLSGYHCNNERWDNISPNTQVQVPKCYTCTAIYYCIYVHCSVVVSHTSYLIRARRSSPANLYTLNLRSTEDDVIVFPNTNLEVSAEVWVKMYYMILFHSVSLTVYQRCVCSLLYFKPIQWIVARQQGASHDH